MSDAAVLDPAPSRLLVGVELLALIAAGALAVASAPGDNWDPALLAVLVALGIASDLVARPLAVNQVKLSASFLAIIAAAVLLGPAPAAAVGVATIIGGWAKDRSNPANLLINLVTYAWFPLLAGLAFEAASQGISERQAAYYLLILATFAFGLAINYGLIVGYTCWLERSSFVAAIKKTLVPLLPSEAASAVLTTGAVFAYVSLGLEGIGLLGIVLLSFQILVDALLASQHKSRELELRARQLAGFQVGMLSSLLHALDMRDRMTARHSAAVALYSRQLARELGLSEVDQELAHTAGLLHDIGKFILPDAVLKAERELTEDDWCEIRRHPYQGAKLISQIDGYAPVSEIVAAHHERWDGGGYPRGLRGEKIPLLARIVAICDAYDVLTARDTYSQPVSRDEALEELRKSSGTYFDPELLEVFIAMMRNGAPSYQHGDEASFEAELELDKRTLEQLTPRPT